MLSLEIGELGEAGFNLSLVTSAGRRRGNRSSLIASASFHSDMAHDLYAEGEAASGIPVDQLLGHFGPHFGDECPARAMHRDHHIGSQGL
jgi:hypothetical protein